MNRPFAAGVVALVILVVASSDRAGAVPIFAQRYGFRCTVCHTVIPQLNAFGERFRRSGFNIPNAPRKGYFPLVLRFQENWAQYLQPSQTRRVATT